MNHENNKGHRINWRAAVRAAVALAAGATLAGGWVTGTGAAGAVTGGQRGAAAAAAAAVPGTQLWARRLNGTGNGPDVARSVAVSPGGGRVFVTGGSAGATSGEDFLTAAYRVDSGRKLWSRRYNTPANGGEQAFSVAVSPTGKTVFVTGNSQPGDTGEDYVTVAYSAASGTQQWVSSFHADRGDFESFSSAASTDGQTVFVTGTGATIAYDAVTGARLWASDGGTSMAVSPTGQTVYVTGTSGSSGPGGKQVYFVRAYDGATGTKLWDTTHISREDVSDGAHAVIATAPGGRVFVEYVIGLLRDVSPPIGYETAAYGASDGSQEWIRYLDGVPASLAAGPAGKLVFVTGAGSGPGPSENYTTVAYGAAAGRQVWVRSFHGPAGRGEHDDVALAVAASRNGKRVYVTGYGPGRGSSNDYLTVGYRVPDGARLWAQDYDGPGKGDDIARAMAVSPVQNRVFVTGNSPGRTSGDDYATIAYHG